MDREEIRKVLFVALERAKQQKIDPATVKPETTLRGDLALDSLAMIETVWEVEEKFGITIDENELKTLSTVGQVTAVVERLVSEKEGAGAGSAVDAA